MNELVFLQNNQAAQDRIDKALNRVRETEMLRADYEAECGENFTLLAWCLNDIAEAFYQFEDIDEAIPATLNAFREIQFHMTRKEVKAFLTLINMARGGIITGYLHSLLKGESKKNAPACVYILQMKNQTVKFGMTADFNKRLATIINNSGMSALNWCHTDYLEHIQACRIESQCMATFQNQRLKGEYFKITFEDACAELEKHAKIINQSS